MKENFSDFLLNNKPFNLACQETIEINKLIEFCNIADGNVNP